MTQIRRPHLAIDRLRARQDTGQVLAGKEPANPMFNALAGDGNGNVTVATRPGYIYVRLDDAPDKVIHAKLLGEGAPSNEERIYVRKLFSGKLSPYVVEQGLATGGGGGGGGGESNTASNVGTGAGVFKEKVGVDLRFRRLRAASSKATVVQQDNEVDVDVVPSAIPHQDLSGAGSNTHAQIDSHLASSANPHGVTKTQVGLANVTNDAQLIRAAGDFATFPEKTTLHNNDELLLEDSEDGASKKRVKVSNLPAGGGGGLWEHVGTAVAGSDVDDLILSGISTTYNRFRVYVFATTAGATGRLRLKLNGDEGNTWHLGRVATTTNFTDTEYPIGSGDYAAGSRVIAEFVITKAAADTRATVICNMLAATDARAIEFRPYNAQWNNTTDKITSIGIWTSVASQKIATGSKMIVEGTTE